jgi:hypothetical protein
MLARREESFFPCKKAHHAKSFGLRMKKNRQYQHKGNPHTQESSQDTEIYVEDAIIIIRGIYLCVPHCNN